MLRSALFISLAVAGLCAGSAMAAEITVSYEGVVVRSSGPHAAEFTPGQAITINYVVDDAASDSNPDPGAGVFHGGLRELRIDIPAAGVAAVTGPGSVQTFNDAHFSDQVFFYADATGGQLAGLPITRAEVDFIDSVVADGGSPVMLASDALPTTSLVTDDSFAMIYTSEGYTFVNFLAEAPEPSVEELVIDGQTLLGDLFDDGRLRRGHASALDSKLAEVLASADAGDVAEACGSLHAFGNQLNALERTGQISAATATELRALADMLGQAIGC